MNILLTNDDGIYAEGIRVLYESLKDLGSVTVVAPDTERSAVGHAITLSDPLRVKKVNRGNKFFGYATTGTPADCVKLAIRAILRKRPDIVISGINLGPNTGYSVLYSGTVSGATEGAILNIPSFAISLATFENPDYSVAASFAKKLARLIMHNKGIPLGTLLNVNIPAVNKKNIKGVKIVRQSRTAIEERFDKREDPRMRTYYWLTGEIIKSDGQDDADIEAIRNNYISITPIRCDMTDYGFMEELKQWKI
ncbi:MAG: 5'/3'-nucleotidase SurE [Omnitrophica WOR_2 bacterium GWF2_43_52]|nr:MAG: 5'/3'-nucleotidase SurE [Omnitrophica WOR_2 bacterium GWF2_43_52]OGX54702.1 MAG: 5'/3'-nucleotidase SurE [Omnitrophica WOR_2 bacterium RIFOXYC2_FULL_43_9]HAH19880.1 5'/3'-nucleotidase SurE [Candidatus Omnitrophota bacterium]HBG63503.1 5'/3'-nucleotidase SurE [Candidatus Omnitrophota bacterium]HCD37132.1 5'/3'-nucleotidase SurE [Candidatus Omnitrophota bacterium]